MVWKTYRGCMHCIFFQSGRCGVFVDLQYGFVGMRSGVQPSSLYIAGVAVCPSMGL